MSILKAIQYLHEGGNFHGNLLEGVWISTELVFKVIIVNFNPNLGENFYVIYLLLICFVFLI